VVSQIAVSSDEQASGVDLIKQAIARMEWDTGTRFWVVVAEGVAGRSPEPPAILGFTRY